MVGEVWSGKSVVKPDRQVQREWRRRERRDDQDQEREFVPNHRQLRPGAAAGWQPSAAASSGEMQTQRYGKIRRAWKSVGAEAEAEVVAAVAGGYKVDGGRQQVGRIVWDEVTVRPWANDLVLGSGPQRRQLQMTRRMRDRRKRRIRRWTTAALVF